MKLNHTTAQLDTLLKRYLRSRSHSTERVQARDELIRTIEHPQQLRSSPLLSEDDPLLHQAYIVSDAFEAVTNGMYNPQALDRLREIDPASPLRPWKSAVSAILAFYQGDRENMIELLKELPEESPPAALARPLRHLAGIEQMQDPTGEEEALVEAVSADRSFIRSAIAQLQEYLTDDQEEAFAETSLLLIRELAPGHPLAGKRLALWSMETAAERGYSLELFPSQLGRTFGESEGMRLAACALRKSDPDIALLFLIRCLLQHMREDDLLPPALAAYFARIAEWAAELEQLTREADAELAEEEGNEEYLRGLGALTMKLSAETHKRYPGLAAALSDEPSPLSAPLRWLARNGGRIGSLYRRDERGEGTAPAEQTSDGTGERLPERVAAEERPELREQGDPRQLELF